MATNGFLKDIEQEVQNIHQKWLENIKHRQSPEHKDSVLQISKKIDAELNDTGSSKPL